MLTCLFQLGLLFFLSSIGLMLILMFFALVLMMLGLEDEFREWVIKKLGL